MSISFEQIPADNLVPIFATEFGGSMSAKSGAMPWKNLIIGQPLASKMDEDGSLTLITSDEQADALYGAGSQLALMVKAFRKNTKSSELWVLPIADDSTADAAEGSLTFEIEGTEETPKLAAGGTIRLMISGQACPVNVSAGDSAGIAANKVADAINAKASLPVTAAAVPGAKAKYSFALSAYTAANSKTATLTIGSSVYTANLSSSDSTIASVLSKIAAAAAGNSKFNVTADAEHNKLVIEAKAVGTDSTTVTLESTATITIGNKVVDVAGSNPGNVVTLTAKNLGAYGNGIDVRWNHNQGEVLPDGLSITLVAMANGGADPSYEDAKVKETCAGNWFNMIVIGSSDADNITYIKEMLDERWTAIVQQTGVMCFSLNGGAETDFTTKANAQNSQEIVIAALPKSPTSGAEKASALFGCIAPKALNDPATPLHNYAVAGVVAPRRDDREDFYGNNRLLKAGCAVMTAAEDGSVFTSRIVTTYKRNAQGVQDKSYMQLETVLTLSYLRWDWNNALALKYPHAKLAPDGSKFGKGQQVMTPSLGKAELIARYKIWEEKGLVYDSEGFAQNVVVELDPNDEYAMNFLIPAHLIKQFFVSKSKLVFD